MPIITREDVVMNFKSKDTFKSQVGREGARGGDTVAARGGQKH